MFFFWGGGRGCGYYDHAFYFHPYFSSASLTLFLVLDLCYDAFSKRFLKETMVFFVYGTLLLRCF